MSALTTNDVRVLRLLLVRGPHSRHELEASLRRTLAGAAPALRRLPKLAERQLIRDGGRVAFDGSAMFDITGEGARALRRADQAAYGGFA